MIALSEAEKVAYAEALEAENARRFLFYKPNKKQELFHEAGIYARERLITGGNRSGKTWCGLNELAEHATGNYNESWNGYRYDRPIRIWVVAKNATVFIETIQRELFGDRESKTIGILHESYISGRPKKAGSSQMYRTVYVNYVSGGTSKITSKTFEEGREAFQSAKVDFILFDEEPPFEIYQEAKMRTTSTSSGKEDSHRMIVVCSTPLKGYTDFFNYFMDNRHPEEVEDSRWHAHITWDDIEHIPPEEKKRLLSGMSPHEVEARTKGVPWPGSGLVYPVQEDSLTCAPFEIPDHWPRVYGIDFGWTNPTAVLFAAHDRDNDVVYLYAEYSVSERTPEKHANALQTFGIKWIPGVYDPSGKNSQQADGKTLVGLYKEAGMKYMAEANNSKEEGILRVLQRMHAGQLKIFSTLGKTLSEFRKYARDEDGIPIKKNDHLMDALRYIVMSGLGKAISKSTFNRLPTKTRQPTYI